MIALNELVINLAGILFAFPISIACTDKRRNFLRNYYFCQFTLFLQYAHLRDKIRKRRVKFCFDYYLNFILSLQNRVFILYFL